MTDVLERVKTYQQFIGGEWVDSAGGATLDVENPADGKVIAKVQASTAEDVDRAVNAASTAFELRPASTAAAFAPAARAADRSIACVIQPLFSVPWRR